MYEYEHGGNAAYEPGSDIRIDLSANINPLGMPDGVKEAITREISNCTIYPDSSSGLLREKLSVFEGVAPDQIFCGSGASDIIFRLPKAVQTELVLVTAPTFSDYERSAISYGASLYRYHLREDISFQIDGDIVDRIIEIRPDLVYICNPNNPTGRLASVELLKDIIDACRQIKAIAVIDECFIDFAENADKLTCKTFIQEYQNLVVLKAFTKLFAMPGLRLGFAICSNESIINRLYFHGADWPVSNIAQAAGIAALENARPYLQQTLAYVSSERKTIESRLTELGYYVYSSSSNFVFFRNPYPFDLGSKLDDMNIRIRSCKNYVGLDDRYYRIAVSAKENNASFLSAMNYITNNMRKGV